MACTPIGVSPPHGVSSRCARHASGFSNSAFGKRHRRFDVQDRPELARADPLAQLRHLGMEAPVVAEPERDAGLARRVDRRLGVGLGQRERLLAEDVLAGRRRPR